MVSWFIPVVKHGATLSQGVLPAWEAFRTALFLEGVSASLATKVWMVTSALTNFIVISSLAIFRTRPGGFKRILPGS